MTRSYTSSVCSFVVLLLCGKAFARPESLRAELAITDVEALTAFKAGITNDPNNVMATWDPNLVDACTWLHITCDANNRVSRVDLRNEGLSGTLAPELGNLDALRYLELQRNNFSGPIPGDLGKLHSLVSLDLFENRLTGPIPQEFDHFEYPHNLKFLRLQNNKLNGSIAATLGIIDLINFNVSGNDLNDYLPTTFSRYDIDSFHPGNPRLCGGPPINKAC